MAREQFADLLDHCLLHVRVTMPVMAHITMELKSGSAVGIPKTPSALSTGKISALPLGQVHRLCLIAFEELSLLVMANSPGQSTLSSMLTQITVKSHIISGSF